MLGATIGGFVLSLGITFRFFLPSFGLPVSRRAQNDTMPPPASVASTALPVRLKIPKISVDAQVEYVGLASNGAMDAPKVPPDVAWFNLGPRPGDNGSAVISGHFGWKNGISAVFDNLHKLRKGDMAYVQDEKGITTVFVVRELRQYGQNENDGSVFISSDGKAHLNLITCEGVWSAAKKSYSDRLVVFTDKATQ